MKDGHLAEQFARNADTHSSRFYRWFNEAPSVALVTRVILAVVQP